MCLCVCEGGYGGGGVCLYVCEGGMVVVVCVRVYVRGGMVGKLDHGTNLTLFSSSRGWNVCLATLSLAINFYCVLSSLKTAVTLPYTVLGWFYI